MTEREWVKSVLRPGLQDALLPCNADGWTVAVDPGKKLTYAYEILQYGTDGPEQRLSPGYETDLLVSDTRDGGQWAPRVVIECKKGNVTTHDALTYSTKAATHKHVHPYLRYGVLIGDFGTALPGRLIRHGAYFDFMMAWGGETPSGSEWSELVDLLKSEIAASRALHALLSDSRSKGRKKFSLLHRPLRLRESDAGTTLDGETASADDNIIPKAWLANRVSIHDAEKGNMVDGVPFGSQSAEWEALKAAMADGDELWQFGSPSDSWQHLAGREGYAIVRNGKAVGTIVTMMS